MILYEKIDENTTLYYVEDIESHENLKGDTIIDTYELAFYSHEIQFIVEVTRANIDLNINMVIVEGNHAPQQEFEELCEEELWDFIKVKCNDYDIWYANLDLM